MLLNLGAYTTGPIKEVLGFSDARSLAAAASTCKHLHQTAIVELQQRGIRIKTEITIALRSLHSLHTWKTIEAQYGDFFLKVINNPDYISLPEANRNEILLLLLPIPNHMYKFGKIEITTSETRISLNIQELYALKQLSPKLDVRVLAWATHFSTFMDKNSNGVLNLPSTYVETIIDHRAVNEVRRALKINKVHCIKISSYSYGIGDYYSFSSHYLNRFKLSFREDVQEIDARDTSHPYFNYFSIALTICIWTLGIAGLMYLAINNLAINTWHIENIDTWMGVAIGSLAVNVIIASLANCFFCRVISFYDHKYTTRTRHFINPKVMPT